MSDSLVFAGNDHSDITHHEKHGESQIHSVKELLPAVVVRNGFKSYKKGVPVLEDLNMTVNRGTIFTLLGNSGCGKSTTLSCILGLTKLSSGNLWVFGQVPGDRGSGVPGTEVGYMPQDYSLYLEYTIEETFKYFGGLNGLDSSKITKAMGFYSDLLQLPHVSGYIHSLSGGEKRRISLAVALIHNPRILILDEPTVGLDPVLRESIWAHLHYLTKTKGSTVIITSHYTEEACYSDMIGVMRHGRLITEQPPTSLLRQFNTYSLQTVVVALFRGSENNNGRSIIIGENGTRAGDVPGSVQPPPMEMLPLHKKNTTFRTSLSRSWAFSQKEFFVTLRNPLFLLSILISTASIFGMCVGMGNPPSKLHFGVVNEGLGNLTCGDVKGFWEDTCEPIYLSCKFFSHVKRNEFELSYYGSTADAREAVERGNTWGYIHFQPEFSSNFFDRAMSGLQIDLHIWNKSDIIIKMDKSNQIVFHQVSYAWQKVLQKFMKGLLKDCDLDPKLGDHSLQYKQPIFGSEDTSFRDFVIPSNFIGVMYFWPVITTGIRYVSEKRQGTLERSFVAGIQSREMFLGYVMIEIGTGILRAILFFITAQYLFQMEIVGSILLQLFLGVLAAFMGTAGGIMLGALCSEEIQVALLSMALYFPNTVLSSQIWQLESMRPVMFQKICYYLPCTLACEAIRSIWSRGWEFSHPNVWPGFASTLAYTIFYLVIAMIIFRLKLNR